MGDYFYVAWTYVMLSNQEDPNSGSFRRRIVASGVAGAHPHTLDPLSFQGYVESKARLRQSGDLWDHRSPLFYALMSGEDLHRFKSKQEALGPFRWWWRVFGGDEDVCEVEG